MAGYYIDKRPGVAADNISVYEYTYKYPVELSTDSGSTGTPIIPDAWHTAIWYAAAAEGAALLEWPEKAQEYESKFMQFIAERKSPQEEAAYSGLAGPRRNIPVGSTW